MGKVLHRRPSASMVVSIVALVVAASGTAVAASTLVKGDKLIKKHSLSGNRLRNHTLSGSQINLSKLGKVPSAANADHATSADNATNATNATNANNAVHATSAGSADNVKTWFMTASAGQTVTLLTIGPFTYTGECTGTSSAPHAQTYVTTSQNNSAADSYAGESGYSSDEMNPWGPSDGKLSVGYKSDEHSADGTAQWVGPYDGSDTQISGDGHTFVNTFATVGTLTDGADCVFTGHALVITH